MVFPDLRTRRQKYNSFNFPIVPKYDEKGYSGLAILKFRMDDRVLKTLITNPAGLIKTLKRFKRLASGSFVIKVKSVFMM